MGFYDAGKDRLILGLWVRNLLWDTDLGSHPASPCPSSPSRVPKATTHRFRTAKSTSVADDRRKFVRRPSTRCNLLRTVVVMLFSVGGVVGLVYDSMPKVIMIEDHIISLTHLVVSCYNIG
jgi:hypothetical protein